MALRVKSIAFSMLSNVPHRDTTGRWRKTEFMGLDYSRKPLMRHCSVAVGPPFIRLASCNVAISDLFSSFQGNRV
jgi:hypothetical protein